RESYSDRREQKSRRRSYSDRPERDSQDKPRKYSATQERESYSDRREQKSRRRSYSDRPERDSRDKLRKYSATQERESYSDRREQKSRRRSYSDRPERDLQDKFRRYSAGSALRTRRKDSVRKPLQAKPDNKPIRLNKFIANSGICSRREADEYIVAGLISVNGRIVTELGTKVMKNDDIRFNKERLKGEDKAYVLLNKPKNYTTTTDDPHAKKTVMELIAGACKERVYPVGRLDRNSTGVLLFTNDGDLAKQLTHPSYNKLKVYQVRLDKNIVGADLKALREGIELEDGQAVADDIHISATNKTELGIEIHSGRNRVIRRMFEKLGYNVVKLDRVYFAGLTKTGLKRGQCRLLTGKEVEMLKMGAYE
ncbi:MAG: pseudouridine synthase, partial [Prevotellaceae bacterium]|nr:pseudouridine synthase [Prevotellaceae bacterium]